mmetsp:Transcript_47764/g.102374  ORF Transcript_47764/g.102374 Transcript_47764/m.102374 type:complete len:340 (+) Transcript_47764:833-1852(+)
MRRGAGAGDEALVPVVLGHLPHDVLPHRAGLDLPLLVILLQEPPEGVTGLPLRAELGLALCIQLLLLSIEDPLLPRGEGLQLGEPLEVLVLFQKILHVAPTAEDGNFSVISVNGLNLLDVLLAILPALLLLLLLVLIHEVLEELVPLLLLDVLPEVPLHHGFRHILVARAHLEVLPICECINEVVLTAHLLLALLLFLPLLCLRRPFGKELLPLSGRGERVEATVLLDELQGLLPLPCALHALLLEELFKSVPAFLLACPLRRFLLLLLLLRFALLFLLGTALRLQPLHPLHSHRHAHLLLGRLGGFLLPATDEPIQRSLGIVLVFPQCLPGRSLLEAL